MFKSLVWLDSEKNRVCHSRGGHLNHEANEAASPQKTMMTPRLSLQLLLSVKATELLFDGCFLSQQHDLRDRSAHTSLRAATLREAADQTFYSVDWHRPASPSADPTLPASGRVATWVPVFKPLAWRPRRRSTPKAGIEPSALEAGALTTRPLATPSSTQVLPSRVCGAFSISPSDTSLSVDGV